MLTFGNSDKALEYQALLLQVENQIKSLESIGLDVTVLRNRVETINNKLNKDLNIQQTNINNTSNVFLQEIYISAITNLEKISNELERNREEYYIIGVKTALIKSNLKNLSSVDVSLISKEARVLLDKIESSSTVDFSIEKDLIEDAYKAIYQVMKLEALSSNEDYTSLFAKVNNSNIHSSFITNLVRNEIAATGSQELLDKQYLLESKGIEYNVLINCDLFRSIALVNDKEYVDELMKKVYHLISEYKDNNHYIRNLISDISKESDDYDHNAFHQKNRKKEIARRISCITGAVVATSFLLFGISRVGSKLDRLYPFTTTTYDLQTGEVTTEEGYENMKKETVTVEEVEPWKSKGVFSKRYSRNTNYYSLTLKPDITDPYYYVAETEDMVTFNSTEDTQTLMPEDFDVQENSFYVSFKEYGEDYKEVVGVSTIMLPCLTLGLISPILFIINLTDSVRLLRAEENKKDSIVTRYKKASKELNIKKEKIEKDLSVFKKLIVKNKDLYEQITGNPLYKIYFEKVDDYQKYINELNNIINSNPYLILDSKYNEEDNSKKI